MARLVIGTDKTATTPAFIREIGEYVGGGLTIDYSKDVNDNLISYPGIVATCGVKGIKAQNLLQNKFVNSNTVTTVDFDSIEVIDGDYTCNATFSNCANLTSISMANLIAIMGTDACRSMFDGSGLTGSLSMPNLTTISGANAARSMFGNCANVTSVSLPNLTSVVDGDSACRFMIAGMPNLTSVYLPSLSTVTAPNGLYALFGDDTSLTTVSFPSLDYIPAATCCYTMFNRCTSLTSVSFPALKSTSFGSYTNQFNRMLNGCSNVTVHFPSSLFAIIGGWSDVTAGFNGSNTTVLYDLPATE